VLTTRRPRNPIGRVFLAVALGAAVEGFTLQYAIRALAIAPGSLPLGSFMAWLSQIVGPVAILPLALLLLLFPNGPLPSRRWWPLVWVLGLCTVFLTVGLALSELLDLGGGGQIPNPIGISTPPWFLAPLSLVFPVPGLRHADRGARPWLCSRAPPQRFVRQPPGHAVARRSRASAAATPPGELVGLDDPAGQRRTTGLEPLTHDLQAEFVKTTERAQVGAHEGRGHVAPIGHPRHEQLSSRLPSRLISRASAPEFGELPGKGSALLVTGSSGGRPRRQIHHIVAECGARVAIREDGFDSAAAGA
jgi:hypothetical protein